jgi:4-amino-4-deoxy-L-arabinose transferase-like glycosyltransferase
MSRKTNLVPVALAAIFFAALLIRLLVIRRFASLPYNDLMWNDAVGWNLATGHGFTASQHAPYVPGLFRSPGYPAFLALLYSLFGHSYAAVFVAQAVLDSLTAVLLALIGAQMISRSVGLLAGFLWALYPYPAMYCGALFQDILLTFCVQVVLLMVALAPDRRHKLLYWLAVGAGLGVVALVKPFLILYGLVPALAILLLLQSVRGRVAALGALAAGTAIVIAPWIVRDYQEFHTFIPISIGGAGHGPWAVVQEMNRGEEDIMAQVELNFRTIKSKSYAAMRQRYLDSFVDGAALIARERAEGAQAAPEIRRRWPEYARLVARHVYRLWITRYTVQQSRTVALAAQILSWMLVVPGVLGMFLLRRQWRALSPLYTTVLTITAIYAVGTVVAFYTLPARPALVVFAAAALGLVWQRLRETGRHHQSAEGEGVEHGSANDLEADTRVAPGA